ncbi:unnamed protein product, partial [Adineta ricciae]
MSDLSNMKAVQLLDLPDELILAIIKKVHPQVLLFCSMIDIDNNRLKQLAFDGCHSIDFTFDYINAPHRSLMKRFYSDVMPLIGNSIQSLTIDLHHIRPIDEYHQNTDNKTLKNLRHLKIMLGAKRSKTGVPYTIVQSFELDDNCLLSNSITGKQLRIPEAVQLTHIRISFWNFAQCVGLLIQLGCQLQSLTVTIAMSDENRETLNNVIQSISCPNLKHLTI